MNSIARAIYTALSSDATLLSLLGAGSASIVGEGEFDISIAMPALVICFAGSVRPSRHFDAQNWSLVVMHEADEPSSSAILERVRLCLDGQSLAVEAGSPVSYMEAELVGELANTADRSFRGARGGARYRVYTIDR